MPDRVTLLSRPGCHLCDDARAIVERVLADPAFAESPVGPLAFEELSIDDDPTLHEEYAEEIPVVLIDGRVHTIWRVDETRFRTALGGPA